MNYSILRFGTLYGPRSDNSNGLHSIIKDSLMKKKIIYSGSPEAMRDYIHVTDLAEIHKKTLKFLLDKGGTNITFNVGKGNSYSVLELINAFERVNNLKIDYEFASRRVGDIAISYADTSKIYNILNWKPSKSIEDMCKDGWNWQKKFVSEQK